MLHVQCDHRIEFSHTKYKILNTLTASNLHPPRKYTLGLKRQNCKEFVSFSRKFDRFNRFKRTNGESNGFLPI